MRKRIIGLLVVLCFFPMLQVEAKDKKVSVRTPVISSVKSISYQSLEIAWERVRGANGYIIYRSEKKDEGYERVGKVRKGQIISFVDEELSCGRTYYYKVKAYREVKEETHYGKASEARRGRCRPDKVRLQITRHGHTYANFTWTKSPTATGYEISRSTEENDKYKVVKKVKGASTLTWKDKKISEKKTYYYKIRAYKYVKKEIVYGKYSKICVKATTDSIIKDLKMYIKVPYRSGGTTPNGWDCSGFAQWVYREKFGISIPRTSGEQAAGGVKVDKSKRASWKPGDILIYASGGRIRHVGIYLGNNQMIHALSTKYDTLIQDVDYYDRWDSENTLVGVRRYL